MAESKAGYSHAGAAVELEMQPSIRKTPDELNMEPDNKSPPPAAIDNTEVMSLYFYPGIKGSEM